MPESGWTKPGAKYVKRIPKPGGGFYYLYPEDIKAQARAKMNQVRGKVNDAKQQIADKSGLTAKRNYEATRRQMSNLMRDTGGNFNNLEYRKTAGTLLSNQLRREKAEYDNSALGKAEKAANKAKSAAKKAAATTADKIGLDERAAYKESQKGLFNPLTRAYKKNRYNETIAGKVERAAKPVTDKIGKGVAAVKALTGDNRVNRTSYEDLDGKKTHYVGQKGSDKVYKTRNKQKAIMYERDKQNVNKVKDTGAAVKREVNRVGGIAKDALYETKENIKETGNMLARGATIDDNIERGKKKIQKATKDAKKRYKTAYRKAAPGSKIAEGIINAIDPKTMEAAYTRREISDAYKREKKVDKAIKKVKKSIKKWSDRR